MNIGKTLENVKNYKPARGVWNNAIKIYALELLQNLQDNFCANEILEISNARLLEKALLNGAPNWPRFSEGGCALICNNDIAARLLPPSWQKRGVYCDLIEAQGRALFQAAFLIKQKAIF